MPDGTLTPEEGAHLRLLLIELGGVLYALESASVREIVPTRAATRLPGAPPHVRGLMNLRGQLITVIDLCQRVTGSPVRNPEGSTIVVQSEDRVLGLSVDDVRDVQSMEVASTESLPYHAPTDHLVQRLGRLGDEVVIVLDVDDIIRQTLA